MNEEWDKDQSFDEGWFLDYLDGAFTILCVADGPLTNPAQRTTDGDMSAREYVQQRAAEGSA